MPTQAPIIRGKTKISRKKAEALKKPGMKSVIRRSHDAEIKIMSPNEFFKDINKPTQSRLWNFMEEVKSKAENMLDENGHSFIYEINEDSKWRLRRITSSLELKEMLANSKVAYEKYIRIQEKQMNKMIRGKEDSFNGSGFAFTGADAARGLPVRKEYTPLIGTPFFKQLYLFDYWEMHSKLFWYKNYSGIAKLIIDMTRNFVMGKGFSVSFEDDEAQDAWARYEDRSNIQEEARNWCDDLTWAGENMLKKIPTAQGIIHRAFDPSTIWDIITDPENITQSGIKYYHQQYNTQYQLYSAPGAPISKYIINQLPPELVTHTKVNVTSYEKRGRSDLLSAMLYFKYYEDYCQAKLARAKNEAAFIWDVSIDGDDNDVLNYINTTENIVDVPPGSENVHNKAITRTPLSPTFGKAGGDQIAKDILSYVAMSVTIPGTYFGTMDTAGGTKAGALVATEPVAKKMAERQLKMEFLIRRIVKDVLIAERLDPNTKFEVNFPELMEEDRSTKIQDLIIAKDEGVISHEAMSYVVAKELKFTKYDYEEEQKKIEAEKRKVVYPLPPPVDDTSDGDPDLTPGNQGTDTGGDRSVDRPQIKQDGHSF